MNRRNRLFWAVYARVYDQLWDNALMAAVGARVARLLPAGSSVLEVGAGTGIVAAQLEARGHSVAVCEPTPAMAARCARRLPGTALTDTRCEDLAEASADHVVAVNVVHILDDPAGGVEWLRRVCRPGGVVVLVTPDPGNGLLAVARAQYRAGVSGWRAARFVGWHLVLGPLAAVCGLTASQGPEWVQADPGWLARVNADGGPVGGVYWLFTLPSVGPLPHDHSVNEQGRSDRVGRSGPG